MRIAPALVVLFILAVPAVARPLDVCPEELSGILSAPLVSWREVEASSDTDLGAKDAIGILDRTTRVILPDGRMYLIFHRVDRILTRDGAHEYADPEYYYSSLSSEPVYVRAITHLPGGETATLLADGIRSSPSVPDQNMYDDARILTVSPTKLRQDAVVEITVVFLEDSTVKGGLWDDAEWLGWGPVHLQEYLLVAESESFLVAGDADAEHTRVAHDSFIINAWSWKNVAADDWENFDDDQFFIAKSADWSDISSWYQNLIAGQEEKSAAIKSVADDLFRNETESLGIVRKAYNYVRSEIRYVSISLGDGAYRPHAPDDVIAAEYGDCKDKSLLLRSLLRERGIDASLAILSTARDVDTSVPSIGWFNHAILHVPAQSGIENALFLDPTASHLRFGRLPHQDAGRPALIVSGSGKIAEIPPARPEEHQFLTRVGFRLAPDGKIRFDVRIDATGIFFERKTDTAPLTAMFNEAGLPDGFMEMTALAYRNVDEETTTFEMSGYYDYLVLRDHMEMNLFHWPGFSTITDSVIAEFASHMAGYFLTFPEAPNRREYALEISMPAGFTIMSADRAERYEDEYFSAENGWNVADTGYRHRRVIVQHLPFSDFPDSAEWAARGNAALIRMAPRFRTDHAVGRDIVRNDLNRGMEKSRRIIGENPDDILHRLILIDMLTTVKDTVGTIALVDEIIAADTHWRYVAQKALLLAGTNRYLEGLALDFPETAAVRAREAVEVAAAEYLEGLGHIDSAAAIYGAADTESLLRGAGLFGRHNRHAEAESMLRRAVALDPENGLLRWHLGHVLGRRGLWDAARGELAKGVKLSPESLGLRLALARMSIQLGDIDAAAKALDELRSEEEYAWRDYLLGLVALARGDTYSGIEYIQEALIADPRHGHSEEMRRLLEKLDAVPQPGHVSFQREGARLVVTYDANTGLAPLRNASGIFLRWGENGWENQRNDLMRNTDGVFKMEIDMPPSRRSVEFVFDDDKGRRDDNSGFYWRAADRGAPVDWTVTCGEDGAYRVRILNRSDFGDSVPVLDWTCSGPRNRTIMTREGTSWSADIGAPHDATMLLFGFRPEEDYAWEICLPIFARLAPPPKIKKKF